MVGSCDRGSSGSGQGPVAGCCVHGNELSISVKGQLGVKKRGLCPVDLVIWGVSSDV